jgi:probable rRNA maturation factor
LFKRAPSTSAGNVVPESLPTILVANHQRRIRFERNGLQQFAERALKQVLTLPGPDLPPEIGVALVSDRRICELHRAFMRLSTPTDVITFQHGEIVVSVDTAERQAAEHGTNLVSEVKLYLLHGLLHLRGYDDLTPEARREMMVVQTRLFAALNRETARPSVPAQLHLAPRRRSPLPGKKPPGTASSRRARRGAV